MSQDLLGALCLVVVLEGLLLFAAPDGWKQVARQMLEMDSRRLRAFGAVMVALGLLSLQLVR